MRLNRKTLVKVLLALHKLLYRCPCRHGAGSKFIYWLDFLLGKYLTITSRKCFGLHLGQCLVLKCTPGLDTQKTNGFSWIR